MHNGQLQTVGAHAILSTEKGLDIVTLQIKKIKTQWSHLTVAYWTIDCKHQLHQHRGCFLYMGMLESEQAHGQILTLVVVYN